MLTLKFVELVPKLQIKLPNLAIQDHVALLKIRKSTEKNFLFLGF